MVADAAPLVLTDVSDRVGTLTLNNPDERNTLTAPMVAEILAAMDAFEADDGVGAIVVTGTPPAFCAGANLGNLAEATGDSLGTIYEGFLRIARSPLPTLAAVNGAAVGAGMNLALGCDVRIVADRAKLDTRFLQLGIHPGGGHTWMLRRIAGPQAAMAAVDLRSGPRRRRGRTHRARLQVGAERLAARGRPRVRRPRRRRPPANWPSARSRRSTTWPTSTITRRRSNANSCRSCGAPSSRGSPNVSPRCSSGSRASEHRRLTIAQNRYTEASLPAAPARLRS